MYVLTVCDRPGCSKLHKVIAARTARPLGAGGPSGPHRPSPVAHPTVSLPRPVASGDVGTHTGTPAGVGPAR